MKTSIKSLVSLCATFALTSGLALADTTPAEIFIFTDGECGMVDEFLTGAILGEGKQISANSANGNVTLICKAETDRPESGRSVVWNYDNTGGMLCGTLDGATDDWHQVISASGKAKLTCHLK